MTGLTRADGNPLDFSPYCFDAQFPSGVSWAARIDPSTGRWFEPFESLDPENGYSRLNPYPASVIQGSQLVLGHNEHADAFGIEFPMYPCVRFDKYWFRLRLTLSKTSTFVNNSQGNSIIRVAQTEIRYSPRHPSADFVVARNTSTASGGTGVFEDITTIGFDEVHVIEVRFQYTSDSLDPALVKWKGFLNDIPLFDHIGGTGHISSAITLRQGASPLIVNNPIFNSVTIRYEEADFELIPGLLP